MLKDSLTSKSLKQYETFTLFYRSGESCICGIIGDLQNRLQVRVRVWTKGGLGRVNTPVLLASSVLQHILFQI